MERDERSRNKRGRVDDNNDEKGVGRLEKRPSVVEEYSYTYSGDEMINGVKYEEEKKTPTPTPPRPPVSAAATATSDTGTDTVSIGLFDQLITNLVNSPRSNHQSEKIDNVGEVAEKGEAVEDGKDGGGSGTIDNIVAQLPRTLSEDTGPATDEASILIHSIIHD